MAKGIDVSHHQGIINWQKVKSAGVDFAIIKAGGSDKGTYTDECFESNYRGAKSVGIHVGAYYYVGRNCTSKADGVADAKRFAKIIEGKQFEYPVYIDLEATSPANRTGATDACIGFCEYMESNGYYCGVYASDISGFVDRLELKRLSEFDKWVARYGSQPKMVTAYGIWQHSETGRISGISGNVDLDECYVNYPALMVSGGLNGFPKPDPLSYLPETKPGDIDMGRIPYIHGMNAGHVQTYIKWVTCLGAGDYHDTREDFARYMSENA